MSPTRTCSMVLAGVFAIAATGHAYVKGGGPAKTDCFTAWQVTSPDVTANRGPTGVDCQDGDPTCDVDGQVNRVSGRVNSWNYFGANFHFTVETAELGSIAATCPAWRMAVEPRNGMALWLGWDADAAVVVADD